MNVYIIALQKAIRDLHGCESFYVSTTPVIETCEGKVVWQGEVETFGLTETCGFFPEKYTKAKNIRGPLALRDCETLIYCGVGAAPLPLQPRSPMHSVTFCKCECGTEYKAFQQDGSKRQYYPHVIDERVNFVCWRYVE